MRHHLTIRYSPWRVPLLVPVNSRNVKQLQRPLGVSSTDRVLLPVLVCVCVFWVLREGGCLLLLAFCEFGLHLSQWVCHNGRSVELAD